MKKGIKIFCLSLLLIMMTATLVNAETLFIKEQVINRVFNSVAATDDLCIAASDYYLAPYKDKGWGTAIYSPKKQFVIKDITAVKNSFYLLEYSEELGEVRFLKSENGENWELVSETKVGAAVKFVKDTEGNILVQCNDDITLPDGFKRFTGTSEQKLTEYSNSSVVFNGEVIDVSDPNLWYKTEDNDGHITEYAYQFYRETNAFETNNYTNQKLVINGLEYISESTSVPALYKIKEDIKYSVYESGKYYFCLLCTDDRPKGSSYISVYEEDENGCLKRDENGDAIVSIFKCNEAITDFKLVDKTFYANFWYKGWQKTTDLENWIKCEEPVGNEGLAETIGVQTKIRLNKLEFSVNYENESLDNPFEGFSIKYSGDTPYKIGEYYYTLDDEYFRLSKDGVYYVSYELPEGFRAFDHVIITEDGDDFVIQSGIYQLRAPKDKIYSKLEEATAEPIYVVFNDNLLAFEQAPVIENGRTLIPLRFLFETMGAAVDWNGDTQTATVSQDGRSISVTIDSKSAAVNGEAVEIDVPARLINGKTMVPVRFLSENLGYNVNWDGDTRIITIE